MTGIVLTRLDGDARGCPLSMRRHDCAIKLAGVGEKQDALEDFDPTRTGRILDMGDVVALVEKTADAIEAEEAERLAKRWPKGQFDR